MSNILFLCSGNTCRSPIAAGIAKRVFGPSHQIRSAGAETGNGGPIAKNAILAAESLGVNISKQSTCSMNDLKLDCFDIIVVFRPSSAENVQFLTQVLVEHLDVDDPYGLSLDKYKTSARKIERGVRRLYVVDAIRRLSANQMQMGSHLVGIFNRAAKECEKEVADFVANNLHLQVSSKATLGQLGNKISLLSTKGPTMTTLGKAVLQVNDIWVDLKHRNDPPTSNDLRNGLEEVKRVFDLLP